MFSNAIDKIEHFLFHSNNPKSLGYMRVGLSAVLLYLSVYRFFNLDQYGTESIVPRDQALQLFSDFFRPMFALFFWPDEWVMVVQIAVTILLFLAMIGLTNRFFMILTWIIMQGFIARNYSIIYGADLIGTLFFFYLSFTKCSDTFSIKQKVLNLFCKKSAITNKEESTTNVKKNLSVRVSNEYSLFSQQLSSLFVRLIQFQLAIIYAYTGFEKLKGNTWWDGTALWTVMANPQFTDFDFIWLRNFPIVFAIGTFVSIIFEVYFPAMMMTRVSKRAWLLLGVLFHLTIGILFSLMPFSLVMISTYLMFLDEEDYSDLKKLKSKLAQSKA